LNHLKNYDKYTLIVIGLLFAVRLFHITDPPIEAAHNWRQATSLMVARNFYQGDHNILYPRVDDCGEKTGIVAMEFPVLSYTTYLTALVFGYDHWYGRLINLVVVSLGLWFFYRLVGLFFKQRIAFYATVALGCSALFHLARKILPDPMALSLVITGVFYGTLFLRNGRWLHLLLYIAFALFGALVKIPFGIYLSVLLFPLIDTQISRVKKIVFVTSSLVIIGTIYWWYFIWNISLSETFGIWYNSGRTWQEGISEITSHPKEVAAKFYFSAFHGYLFFAVAMAGLIMALRLKQRTVLYLVGICIPLFILYMLKSGYLFYHHGYYALVIVPVLVLLVAFLLDALPVKWAAVILVICITESIANQQHDFFIRKAEFAKLELESMADQFSTRDDRVALDCESGNPNEFYFLNRKGWLVQAKDMNETNLLRLKALGCRYLVLNKARTNTILPFDKVFENHEFVVFRL
jgi:4-amino-4-deoxy-L-arabinose transferase-like glycosyltransferase